METRSTTATTADAYVSAETPRSTAYLLATQLFAGAPLRAGVIVKRRRLVLQRPEVPESIDEPETVDAALTPTDSTRAPRVFVVARDDAASAGPVEPALERPAQPVRRRVEPARRPGKVVLLVPPPVGVTAADPPMEPGPVEPDANDLGFLLERVEEHRAVQAALERVRALTADALAASKLRF